VSKVRGRGMKKIGLVGLALVAPGGFAPLSVAEAADAAASGQKAAIDCKAPDAPYKNYDCLDAYLGDGFFERLMNFYKLEWGHEGPPADPKAPPGRRAGWPDAPATVPPFPFTEWPYGGATSLGVTRPSSADSPLMVALANTDFGKALNAGNMQIYGWINGGGNISTNTTKAGGNSPAAYDYWPNHFQFDQGVVYFERTPDTVQTDSVDWGFRISALYGQNYRYTSAYGIMTYQLIGHNLDMGWDFPMVYGELYIPQIAEGLLLRLGRFISVPDIEAQLAPNNYMYTHSMTYTWDNYTNTGLQGTLALNKNWFLQLGLTVGTEALPWHWGETVPNPFPNAVYSGPTILRDPGAMPSVTAGVRWQSDNGWDNVYVVADAINSGIWGYNNLQWTGITWYHRINEQWHFSWEMYTLDEYKVLNLNNSYVTTQIIPNGGFPFSVQNGFPFNAPNGAFCSNPNVLTCTARDFATVMYLNYQFSPLDNISFRPEFFNDMEGQRTGVKTRYVDFGIGWQHWFSPQVEIRPEVTYYRSLDAPAFNGNVNEGIAPTKNYALIAAADLIWHF
jgi:Putative beta-barrel porin-2, OmpL-like. bbp2